MHEDRFASFLFFIARVKTNERERKEKKTKYFLSISFLTQYCQIEEEKKRGEKELDNITFLFHRRR